MAALPAFAAPLGGEGAGSAAGPDAGDPPRPAAPGSRWLEPFRGALEGARERARLGLEVGLESAIGLGDAHAQQSRLRIEPDLELELPRGWTLTAVGRLRADAFDRLEPGEPSQPEVSQLSRRGAAGDRADADLRELHVEGAAGRAFFRVGKQHIVWGKADGLKVLDLVNPQDFHEFILDEFEDSRITLWAVNVEVPVRRVTVQLVWLPDPSYHDLPEPEALYAFTSPKLIPPAPPGVTVDLHDPDRPRRLLSDSDAGLRLSTFFKGWDLTLNYLYHYHDVPIPFRRVVPSAEGPVAIVEPGYERTHLLGGTFSNAFGSLTLRGEYGLSSDRFLPTADPLEADGAVETEELSYVLGLDWYGFDDHFLSLQLFQSWIPSHRDGVLRDEVETDLTFLVQRRFWHDTLEAELIWLVGLNEGDGLVRPKLTYDVRDDLRVWAGLDIFYGSRVGLFGQFGERDRFVLGAEWTY